MMWWHENISRITGVRGIHIVLELGRQQVIINPFLKIFDVILSSGHKISYNPMEFNGWSKVGESHWTIFQGDTPVTRFTVWSTWD